MYLIEYIDTCIHINIYNDNIYIYLYYIYIISILYIHIYIYIYIYIYINDLFGKKIAFFAFFTEASSV